MSEDEHKENIENIKNKVLTLEDFINSPKHGNSLKEYLKNNNKDINDASIQKLLALNSPQEIKEIYKSAVEKLKILMNKN